MTVRNIKKNLAGAEDLLLGRGVQVQVRGGSSYTIHKLELAITVNNVLDLANVDETKFPFVLVGSIKYEYINGVWVPLSDWLYKGSFDTGCVLTTHTDLVTDANGDYFSYIGGLPYTVPASSAPTTNFILRTKEVQNKLLTLGQLIFSLPTFTSNATAVAAGKRIGELYKTSAGEVRIVV